MALLTNTTPLATNGIFDVQVGAGGLTDTATSLPATFADGDSLMIDFAPGATSGSLRLTGPVTLGGLSANATDRFFVVTSTAQTVTLNTGTYNSGGPQLIFTAPTVSSGDLVFGSDVVFGLNAMASLSGLLDVSGHRLDIQGGSYADILAQDVVVLFAPTISGTLTATGTLNVSSNATLGGAVALDGDASMTITGLYNGTGVEGIGAFGANQVFVDGRSFTGDIDLGSGDDTVTATEGSLTGDVFLGNGNDQMRLEDTSMTGRMIGNGGTDSFTGITTGTHGLTGNINMGAGNDDVTLTGDFRVTGRVNMGDGDDVVTLQSTDTRIVTGVIDLGDGLNSLSSDAGTLTGRIFGGADQDALTFFMGAIVESRITLGDGDDVITLADGAQLTGNVFMGAGDDQVNWSGATTVSGRIALGAGDDFARLGEGDALALGNAGNDTIQGEGGNDTLYGHGGDDSLDGGSDDDVLHGGGGADHLTGGGGFDTFLFASGHSRLGGNDTISDFVTAEDAILLDGFVSPSEFIGENAFSATGGREARYTEMADHALLEVDFDGDGAADLTVEVYGVTTLTAFDLLLFDV